MKKLIGFCFVAVLMGVAGARADDTNAWQLGKWAKGAILLPVGNYHGSSKPIRTERHCDLTVSPGTVIEQARFETENTCNWKIEGSLFRNVDVGMGSGSKWAAKNSVFDGCVFRKVGGWSVAYWGTRWNFENCVFSKTFLPDFIGVENYSVRAIDCTFYDLNLPIIGYKGDPSGLAQSNDLRFEHCRFVNCEVSETLLAVTMDCVFDGCRFITRGLPDWSMAKKPMIVNAFVTPGSNTAPKSFSNGPLQVNFQAAAPTQKAGSTLVVKNTGSSLSYPSISGTGPSSLIGEADLTGTGPYIETRNKVAYLIRAEKWDELEDLVATLRKGPARWPNGMRKLTAFYQVSTGDHSGDQGKSYEEAIAKAGRWVAAKPESIAARVSLGGLYVNYGWQARGRTTSVSAEGGRLFRARLAKAREVLTEAEKLQVKDADLYVQLMNISGGESGWNPELDEYYKKAVALEPTCDSAYITKANFIQPRWGGEPGQWAKFADEAARQTEKDEGYSLYARIVFFLRYGMADMAIDPQFLTHNQISWEKLKRGFQDLIARYPAYDEALNAFCAFACLAGDRETAQALFTRIGNNPVIYIWKSKSRLARWQLWANPTTPKKFIEPRQTLDTAGISGQNAEPITTVQFSPDGKWIAAGTEHKILLWKLGVGIPRVITAGGWDQYQWVSFSPDGKTLAVCTAAYWTPDPPPGSVVLWDVATGEKIAALDAAKGEVAAALFTADGQKLFATGGSDHRGEVNVWDLKTRTSTAMNVDTVQKCRGPVLSRDGTLLCVPEGNKIVTMDVATGRNLFRGSALEKGAGGITSMAFSPDGQAVGLGSDNGHMAIVDPLTAKKQDVKFSGHGGEIYGLAFTPDGKTLISCSNDESIKFHDVATGRTIAILMGHGGYYTPLDISADGKTLATAGADGIVKLWDIDTILKETVDPAVIQWVAMVEASRAAGR